MIEGQAALLGSRIADRAGVLGAGHVEARNIDLRIAIVQPTFVGRHGRTHRDGGFHARVGERGVASEQGIENLAGHRQRCVRAEGMTGDTDAVEVETIGEGRLFPVQFFDLIDGEADILNAVDGVAWLGSGACA